MIQKETTWGRSVGRLKNDTIRIQNVTITDLIQPSWDNVQCSVLVHTLMNLGVHKRGEFLHEFMKYVPRDYYRTD
jgi:hypothetical protein